MLSDREKLLISAVYMMKKSEVPLDDINRSKMIDEYSLSLDVNNTRKLYIDIKNTEAYLVRSFTDFLVSQNYEYDTNQSMLDDREQFILLQLEFMFMQTIGVDKESKYDYLNNSAIVCGITDIEKILQEVEKQVITIEEYIDYWIINKKGI